MLGILKRYVFFILVILIHTRVASGQIFQYKFINYNSNNGLSQNSVYSIDQDSLGRLWIATANDINIWDGHEFYMYSDLFKGRKYLSSKNIKKIHLYKNKCIVLNDAGIEIIDTKNQTLLPIEEANFAIDFDVYSNQLFFNNDSILFAYDLESNTIIYRYIIRSYYSTIFAFRDFIYAYSIMSGGKIIDLYSQREYVIPHCILKKVKYNNNYIPVMITKGLTPDKIPANIYSQIHFFVYDNLESISSFYLHEDKFWIAQYDSIYIIQSQKGKYIKQNKKTLIPELSQKFIYDFFTDYKNNLYILTNINGFYIFSKDINKFTHIRHPNPNFNMVKSIHVLSDSTIVAGVYPKGIIFYHPNGQFQTFVTKNMKPVWDMESSFKSNDEYYVLTSNIIYAFNKAKLRSIIRSSSTEEYSILHRGINSYFLCFVDRMVENSRIVIEELTADFRPIRSIITDKYVTSLLQKDHENLLVGRVDGVWCYNLKNLTAIRILKDRAQSITKIQNSIYICSNNGLFILDNNLNIRDAITKKTHSISDDFIYACLMDSNKNIWISNNKGLSLINLVTKKVINYTINDGLQSNEFNTNAFYNYNGILYFGGVNGINVIPKNYTYRNSKKPNVYHTNFLVDDEIKIDDTLKNIVLNYSNNTISLSIRHINFTNKEKSEYFHRLTPLEKNFINTGNNNFLRYSNLPEGKYTLEYYVVNQYGNQSDVKRLSIIILPPFWRTWWFYTLVILSAVIMNSGFIIYLYEKNRQKILLQVEIQKNLESERMRISRELHDNVGAHLSYLISQIQIFASKYNNLFNEEDTKKFMKLELVSKEAIQTIRETIWLLNKRELTIEQFIDKTKQYVYKIRELNENIETEYYENLDTQIIIPPSTAINLLRIVQESITNSYRHSRCSRIKIYFENPDDKLHIRIMDDGVGFDINNEFLDHYGLKNLKARADEINAQIEIRSEKMNGTCVEIKLNLQHLQYM
ncbi:MAG: two-component regulator propeller domain-containing protein [Thermaurantimonas sp.]